MKEKERKKKSMVNTNLKASRKLTLLLPFLCSRQCTLFENYSKCRIRILAFSTNFCPIKTDLSGNTVWPQASGFQKLAKMDHFGHFLLTFVHSKCKRSSLRSQWWMRLFLWFSNTVLTQYFGSSRNQTFTIAFNCSCT